MYADFYENINTSGESMTSTSKAPRDMVYTSLPKPTNLQKYKAQAITKYRIQYKSETQIEEAIRVLTTDVKMLISYVLLDYSVLNVITALFGCDILFPL